MNVQIFTSRTGFLIFFSLEQSEVFCQKPWPQVEKYIQPTVNPELTLLMPPTFLPLSPLAKPNWKPKDAHCTDHRDQGARTPIGTAYIGCWFCRTCWIKTRGEDLEEQMEWIQPKDRGRNSEISKSLFGVYYNRLDERWCWLRWWRLSVLDVCERLGQNLLKYWTWSMRRGKSRMTLSLMGFGGSSLSRFSLVLSFHILSTCQSTDFHHLACIHWSYKIPPCLCFRMGSFPVS